MADYGLKISRDGYDITNTDPRNMVFSSGYNTAAIALQGTSAQTGNSGAKTFTIAHGLAFIPFVMVYFNTSYYSSNWKLCPMSANTFPTDFLGNADTVLSTDIRVDATNLVVVINLNNGASDTVTIKYYCLNTAI